ncbi:MAG: CCA tRNA nucleotidyltransferase [Oscillospiraceae bacterium]|nr:CCA tRNA nucleotidyltransferase [Oscillospiraceae bacterium]
MNINFALNPNAVKILQILESQGFQAYIVGGAVRDILMRQTPHDYDICTDALPPQIKDIFGSLGFKTVLVGEKYGTVQILIPTSGRENGEFFEVTTFRTDNEYIDGRHPESVNFSKNIADDLKRRDFTVNAMSCSVDSGGIITVIDIFGGQSDIKNKVVRAVGDPCERFSEDALRMIRAVRFSAKLGFEIEESTKSAICNLAGKISLVSKERISIEAEKILLSDNPEKFLDLSDLNLLKYFMPLLDEKIKQNQSGKINRVKFLEKDFCVRFAALFDIYSANADELKKLRMKNSDIKNITKIVSAVSIIKINSDFLKSKIFLKRILRDFGKYVSDSALNIADILYNINALGIMREIESNDEPYKLSDLKINGDDIINMTNGENNKNIGFILAQCLEYVIENPDKNARGELLEFAERLL